MHHLQDYPVHHPPEYLAWMKSQACQVNIISLTNHIKRSIFSNMYLLKMFNVIIVYIPELFNPLAADKDMFGNLLKAFGKKLLMIFISSIKVYSNNNFIV